METGTIKLNRKLKQYLAGFCMMKLDTRELHQYLPLLHRHEIALFKKFKYSRRRMSYLLGRITAKKAITASHSTQNLQSLFIDAGIFNFPVVKNCETPNIQVSISHCEDMGVALAFSEEHPLALDLEKINEKTLHTMKSQLTREEFDLIAQSGLSLLEGCTYFWTIKESLSKVLKIGLTIDFKLLEIKTLEWNGDILTSTFKNHLQYKTVSYHLGEYILSVVLPRKTTAELDDFQSAIGKYADQAKVCV